MAEDLGTLDREDPRDLREGPVEAHQETDPRASHLLDRERDVAGIEAALFLGEEVELAVHMLDAPGSDQQGAVVDAFAGPLAEPRDQMKVPLQAKRGQRLDGLRIRGVFGQCQGLFAIPEVIPAERQLGEHDEIGRGVGEGGEDLGDVAPGLAEQGPELVVADAHRRGCCRDDSAACYLFFFGRSQSAIVVWRARPRVSCPGGASWVRVVPAPIVAPSPTLTGAMSWVSEPMKT